MRINEEDFRELNRSMGRLAKVTGQTVRELLPSEARLLCVELSRQTIPLKFEKPVKFIENLRRFILAIYPSKGMVHEQLQRRAGYDVADAFWSAIEKKRDAAAQKIIDEHLPNLKIGPFDGGALHEAARTMKKLPRRILVKGRGPVNKYIAKKVASIGRAKSGWAAAAMGVGGTRDIPKWARLRLDEGRGMVTGDNDNLTVIIENNVPYLFEIEVAGAYDRAFRARVERIEKNIKRQLDRETRQIKRKIANVQKVFR
jgi:hypothetical protein